MRESCSQQTRASVSKVARAGRQRGGGNNDGDANRTLVCETELQYKAT